MDTVVETIEELKAQLAFERQARKLAERILDERSLELSLSNTELKDLTRSLERRVDERTSELEKSRDEALKLAEVKSDFLANMSHELRTPLNGVLGMLALLKKTDLDVKQIKLISTAVSSGELLLALINDVLDLSKLEHDKLTLENIPFDPKELIQMTCEPFANQALEKGVEFIYILSPDLPLQLKGDPTRIKQIVTNLVSNALKFTEQGEVLVSAHFENDEFVLAVSDTGIGMTPEQMTKVMEKFSQANESTTRNFGGTGLGLAICQRLIDLMKGNINIKSEHGKGSCFEIRMPLMVQEGELELFYSTDLNDKNVIIALPNVHLNHYVESLLRYWNIHYIDKTYSLEGLNDKLEINQANIDLIIIDHSLLADEVENFEAIVKQVQPNCNLVSCWPIGSVIEQLPNHRKILLPLKQSELFNALIQTPETDLKRDYLQQEQDKKLNFNNANLLLAEDNLVNQQVATELLKHYGCNVTIANNGEEAVEIASTEEFDLIFMDIQMPVLDGIDACQQLRQLGVTTPMVALTAHSLEGDREKSLQAGMDDHLTKPIEINRLANVLSRFLTEVKVSETGTDDPSDDDIFSDMLDDFMDDTSANQLSVLNVEAAMGRLLNNEELYFRVLSEFRSSTDDLVPKLKLALDNEDYKTVKSDSHTIKGSAASIGADMMQQVAAEMEHLAKNTETGDEQAAVIFSQLYSQLLLEKEKLWQRIDEYQSTAA